MAFTWPSEPLSSDKTRLALRQSILEQICAAKSGHPGGSLSLVEILAAIFDGHFEHEPKNPERADRDRFVLSKGHGVPALYSLLSYLGYFPPEELAHLRSLGHFLQGHPDRLQFPLMEASTGSLGQGVSVALGLALALRLQFEEKQLRRLPRVYCVLGDGEMQEGQVWESLLAAGKFKPGNLVFILDYNKGQIDGPVSEVMNLEPIMDKVKAFNWRTVSLDGHDLPALKRALAEIEVRPRGEPTFIVAHTVKGKGVSFMEGLIQWHGVAPTKDELKKSLDEFYGPSQRPFGQILG